MKSIREKVGRLKKAARPRKSLLSLVATDIYCSMISSRSQYPPQQLEQLSKGMADTSVKMAKTLLARLDEEED